MLGDAGDDWMEGGAGGDILVGDQAAPTGQVPLIQGNDVLDGGLDGDKMQGFSGDDIMLGQGGFDKFLGELGFDWGSYEKETSGVDVDMNLRLFVPNAGTPAGDAVRDFWTSTEGLSGSRFDDVLGGEAGSRIDPLNELSNTGLIFGLQDGWNGASNNFFAAGSEVHYSEGNMILGGGGSDVITGDSFKIFAAIGAAAQTSPLGGGQDIIDGDAWLHVELIQGYQPGSQILREIVFGNLDGSPDTRANDVDTAVYNDVIDNYQVFFDFNGDGIINTGAVDLNGNFLFGIAAGTAVDNSVSANSISNTVLRPDAQGFIKIEHNANVGGGGGGGPVPFQASRRSTTAPMSCATSSGCSSPTGRSRSTSKAMSRTPWCWAAARSAPTACRPAR